MNRFLYGVVFLGYCAVVAFSSLSFAQAPATYEDAYKNCTNEVEEEIQKTEDSGIEVTPEAYTASLKACLTRKGFTLQKAEPEEDTQSWVEPQDTHSKPSEQVN